MRQPAPGGPGFVAGGVGPALPVLLVVLTLAIGWGRPVRAEPVELLVSAAASLREVLAEAGPAFSGQHPDVSVAINLGASGQLAAQIESGAPVDVFVSASAADVERLVGRNLLVPGSRRDVAANALVLIVPRDAPDPPPALAALTGPSVRRVGVGNPATVPAGRYAREALQHAGLLQDLQPRLVLAETVRQVLDYVARGEVDAGLVYRTDARIEARVLVVAEVPASAHAPIVYPAAVVAASRRGALARAFVDFLASGEGRSLFVRHGFSAPPALPSAGARPAR